MFRSILWLAGCAGSVPTTPAEDPPSDPGTTVPSTPVTTPPARDPRFDAVVPALEEELEANLAEGVSIAVMEDGAIVWAEGFGTAEPGADVPVTPDTLMQIGSTTKQMTATLVLREVEAGALSLDDRVADLLPGFTLAAEPGWAPEATLHALLSHQGGLLDYVDTAGPADDPELAAWHYDFYGPQLWNMNPPGLFWNYSNPNYTFAGLIAESHDPGGRYWADLAAEELFAPLGMTSTFGRKSEVTDTGRFALSTGTGATSQTIGPVPMGDVPDPASARPAGFVWSTPSDMCRWGQFVLDGDPAILDDGLRAQITTPQVSTRRWGDHLSYGYGEDVWDLYPLSDGFYPIRVWEHGGNTLSFTSVLLMLPDEGTVISILSTGYGDRWDATTEALLHALIVPFPDRSDYDGEPLDPSAVAGHVGSYMDLHNVGPIEISAGGKDGLQIAMPILDQYGYAVGRDLVAESTDRWYVDIDGDLLDLTFIDDVGPDSYVRNRGFVGTRTADDTARIGPPSREAVAAALDRARNELR